MGRGNRHALGAVDGGATAKSDQAIALVFFADGSSGAHRCFGRVGGRGVKHSDIHAFHGIQSLLQQARGFDACIRHDQGTRDAYTLALLGQALQSAEFNMNLGDVKNTRHGVFRSARCRMPPL